MDFYETLYGKCQNCTFSVITLPDKGVRHFETIASMREEIGRVGDSRNTYIHPWPRRIGLKDGVRGDSADTTYATCLLPTSTSRARRIKNRCFRHPGWKFFLF